jgi:D-3-phosphoglycerate dehydrogenase
MMISVVEPLGIGKEELERTLRDAIGEGHRLVLWEDRKETESDLVERCKDADVVVVSNIRFGKAVIDACPNLKMICVAFTGVDHVDLDECRKRGIRVSNCAGYSTVAVADLVFALALSLARNVPACDKAVRDGGTKAGLVGFELEGKTFGVVGMGAIGTRVATIAQAFGCKVLACSRTKKEIAGVTFVDLHTLLARSDIVSLHVPQNEETIGMIGKEEFSAMKRNAMLINAARGPVVDTRALAEALERGTIACAGIDVFDTEPPLGPDNPLLGAPHTLLTPHVAFASEQAFSKRAVIVARDIKAFLDGSPINVVV